MPDRNVGIAEQSLRAAVEAAPSGLLMISDGGRIILVNREIERLFGYSREELLGNSIEMLVPERYRGHHGSDRQNFFARPSVRAMGAGRDLFGRRKDGSEVPVEIGLTPVVTDEGVFVLAAIVDITARKQAEAERRRLEGELRQAQKLEALGTLAGGVAHDFNNILGAIIGYAELIKPTIANDEGRQDLEELLIASDRGRRLVERILAFSRRQAPERRPAALDEIVAEGSKLLRATLPAQVEIRTERSPGSTRVLADALAVHQVVMNLGTNAWHAMPNGGSLELRVEPTYVRDHVARSHPDLHEGEYVLFSAIDTGHGMEPAILSRALEPFFTTKPPGEGTGLGLAMVHGIMREHGGAVLVESTQGVGTRVKCYFPAMADGDAEIVTRSVKSIPGGAERILLIDDEPSIGRVTQRRLAALGYQVTVKTDPINALNLFRADPSAFDLVLTDNAMPRMSGVELAKAIVGLRPGIPIVLVTGYLHELSADALVAAGITQHLLKPATSEDLSRVIRLALGVTA